MITLIIILVMLGVVVVIAFAVSMNEGHHADNENRIYHDLDGNHVYYDESIIEKKHFQRLYPNGAPRAFRRLFGKNK